MKYGITARRKKDRKRVIGTTTWKTKSKAEKALRVLKKQLKDKKSKKYGKYKNPRIRKIKRFWVKS